jgi:hypothetical protein
MQASGATVSRTLRGAPVGCTTRSVINKEVGSSILGELVFPHPPHNLHLPFDALWQDEPGPGFEGARREHSAELTPPMLAVEAAAGMVLGLRHTIPRLPKTSRRWQALARRPPSSA